VAFSGGVDSTALAILETDATPVFTDTGWEFPHVYQHLERFEDVTGREVVRLKSKHGTLPEYIRAQKFFPNHGARFCTRLFKIEPMNAYLAERLPCELMIGLRADENRVGHLSPLDGVTVRYPLAERGMNRADVVAVCVEAGLLPRYPVYAARGGCIGCFYKRRAEVDAMAALVPDVLTTIADLEDEIQDERGRAFHAFANVGVSARTILNQPQLWPAEQVYAAASAREDYGDACGLFCNR